VKIYVASTGKQLTASKDAEPKTDQSGKRRIERDSGRLMCVTETPPISDRRETNPTIPNLWGWRSRWARTRPLPAPGRSARTEQRRNEAACHGV
jgi:hypothetical protein